MTDADTGSGLDPDVAEIAAMLYNAARAGATETIRRHVESGIPADLTNQNGDTLLMLAAYHGHLETVRALLDLGADPDRPNERGQTPIAGAVFKAEPAVVRALLDGGADPRTGHPSAVETARMFGHDQMLGWFGEAS